MREDDNMKYDDTFEVIKNLEFDKKYTLYSDNQVIIYVLRPSKLSGKFKDYDINKNFQIFIKEGEREFRPNHLRVFLDLNLRVRCRPDLKEQLLLLLDEIFYGKDPEELIKELEGEEFEQCLNSLGAIATLSQLFLIEQEYGYNKQSKFEPPTLFYQGWVREFIDSPKEIDNLCMSVCRFQSPLSRYTVKENKKNRKYEENINKLWYIK